MTGTEVEVWRNASTDRFYVVCPSCMRAYGCIPSGSEHPRYYKNREAVEKAVISHRLSKRHLRAAQVVRDEEERLRADREDTMALGEDLDELNLMV